MRCGRTTLRHTEKEAAGYAQLQLQESANDSGRAVQSGGWVPDLLLFESRREKKNGAVRCGEVRCGEVR